MQLTQEYFDKGINNLQDSLENYLDKRIAGLATKDDLAKQTEQLRDYTHQAFEAQQVYIDEGFKEIRAQLDIRKDVKRLEQDMEMIKKALAGQGFKISWQK